MIDVEDVTRLTNMAVKLQWRLASEGYMLHCNLGRQGKFTISVTDPATRKTLSFDVELPDTQAGVFIDSFFYRVCAEFGKFGGVCHQ